MRCLLIAIVMVCSMSAKAQVTTQAEYQILNIAVKIQDEPGGAFRLSNYSLEHISTATINNITIEVRTLKRVPSNESAGYSIKTTLTKPYMIPTVNYFGLPAADNGTTESYGWGIFYQAFEVAEPSVQKALVQWLAKYLSAKM